MTLLSNNIGHGVVVEDLGFDLRFPLTIGRGGRHLVNTDALSLKLQYTDTEVGLDQA